MCVTKYIYFLSFTKVWEEELNQDDEQVAVQGPDDNRDDHWPQLQVAVSSPGLPQDQLYGAAQVATVAVDVWRVWRDIQAAIMTRRYER